MYTDAWFSIGDSHVVCEDFALAGQTLAGEGYAVVCDGCSSSPHTDVGARLLAAAAVVELAEGRLPSAEVVARAARAAQPLQLPSRCLDATLLVALTDPTGCQVRVFGDGLVTGHRRDGGLQIHRFEHPDSAPPYPSYGLDEERQRLWQTRCSPVLVEYVEHVEPEPPEPVEHTSPPALFFSREEYCGVTLGSDGLDAFVKVDDGVASPVPAAAVLERLLRVVSPRGRFVARRGRRFVRRECVRAGWRPTDDISVATILWEPSRSEAA